MKKEKTQNNRRGNNKLNKIEVPKINISLSPMQEKKYTSPKRNEIFPKDILENTRKYIEMTNGNNSYLISPISSKNDFSTKYTSPNFKEELNIAKKYMDINNYTDYSPDLIQEEIDNDNGNERLHKVKDEYIEYLQRQLDENNKNAIRLETKLNELQKRFKNLIDDNKVLSESLNEKSKKLNEFIQENETLRLQVNNFIDNETKYKFQLQYYQKQIGLYENNINDYNNIINELKVSNEKLTNNLSQNVDKNNVKDFNNNNNNKNHSTNNYNNYNYYNVKNINGNERELEFIKNQNMIFENDIKSRDYTIELINKKNNKLMNENKIYKSQIQQYAQQINNLYNILKQKNKIISIYRQKEGFTDNTLESEFEKKIEEFNLNFLNNNNLLLNTSNDDIINTTYNYNNININTNNIGKTQLISNNEKNKKRVDKATNKININPINKVDNKNIKNNNNINIFKTSKINNRSPIKIENGEKNLKYGNTWRILVSPKKKEEKTDLKAKTKEEKNNNAKNATVIKKDIKEENNKSSGDQINKKEEKKENKTKKGNSKPKHIKFAGILDEKEDIKNIARKKNHSHVPKVKKKFRISDFLDITEINTSSPVAPQNLSFSKDDTEYINSLINSSNSKSIYLFGIDREDYLYLFDLKEKRFSKKKILEIEDISDTFSKDYQYEGTILYNTLEGIFILTGKKSDILYYYNSKYDTINKICQFNNSHDNGNLLLDKEFNRLFVLGGKETTKCEYYSFSDKKIYSIPDLTSDRANAAFIICNNKIYGFFGFSYKNNKYCGTMEYIDNKKLDKWYELKNTKILKENMKFDVESVSTLSYKEDNNKILIYAGIQGDNEDYVTENYYLYDTKENSIDLVEKWNSRIMKYVTTRWRNSNYNKKELAGYHFAKNSNFLLLPKSVNIEGYQNDIYLLMDYKNNVHFIDQDEKSIEIFKSDV